LSPSDETSKPSSSQIKVTDDRHSLLLIQLHYANTLKAITVLTETRKGSKRRYIDVSEMAESLTPVVCSAFLGLCAFTGCGNTSAFGDKGEVNT